MWEFSSLGLERSNLGLGWFDEVSVSTFQPGLDLDRGCYALDYIIEIWIKNKFVWKGISRATKTVVADLASARNLIKAWNIIIERN